MPASRSARQNLPVEEVEHQRGDFRSFVFEREMSRIEQMKLGIGQIAQVCAGAAGFIYAPDAGVWISAKASGLTSLLPAGAQNWYEDMDDRERAVFDSTTGGTTLLNAEFSALDQAIGGTLQKRPRATSIFRH